MKFVLWYRPGPRVKWRIVAEGATSAEASNKMYDLMAVLNGDWLTLPAGVDANKRPL